MQLLEMVDVCCESYQSSHLVLSSFYFHGSLGLCPCVDFRLLHAADLFLPVAILLFISQVTLEFH